MGRGTAGLGLLAVIFMFLLVLMPFPVHAASTPVQQNNNSCPCSSLSVSFLSNVVSGNVLVVGVTASGGATLSTVKDSLSSSFTQAVTSSDGTASAYIFYATVSLGGANIVTATFSGGTGAGIFVYEVSGVLTTGATTGHNAGVSTSMSTFSPTAFQAGAFLLGVIGTNNGGFTATAGAGFTLSPTTPLAFAEYSTSGVSSPTTFPASTSFTVEWAEAGLALQPAPTPPIPEYSLGLPILAILTVILYGLIKRRTRSGQ